MILQTVIKYSGAAKEKVYTIYKDVYERAKNALEKRILISACICGLKKIITVKLAVIVAAAALFTVPVQLFKTKMESSHRSAINLADSGQAAEKPKVDLNGVGTEKNKGRGDVSPGSRKASGGGAVSRSGISRSDVYLMARVIEGEAADESFTGKVAVGAVIINRMESGKFPKSLRGVVYQPLAFEAVSNGQYTRPLTEESLRAAETAISGHDPTGGALYYWNPRTATSKWVWQKPINTKIGRHVFAN